MNRIDVMYYLKISKDPIDVNFLYQKLLAPEYGGICMFAGTVRQWTGEIETKKIEYTAYQEMAEKELNKLAEPIEQAGGRVVVVHRLGVLGISDTAVFVGVATPRRAEAFKDCHYVIDTLKKDVPIWKKEYDTDKVRWGK